MPQVRLYNKQTGITYVYEATNYYDPEKKQSRSKRKLIGKLDPVTGEIIPTGKVGRASKPKTGTTYTDAEYTELQAKYVSQQAKLERTLNDLVEKENARAALDQELRATRKDIREYKKLVRRTISVLYSTLDAFHPEIDIDEE